MEIKSSIQKRHQVADKITQIFLLLFTIISASLIILIIWQISGRALRPFFPSWFADVSYSKVNFWSFITGIEYYAPLYRIGFIIINTLYVVLLSIIVSTPIAVLTALFIAKMAPKVLGNILNTIVEVLAAIPSIIFGVFGSSALDSNGNNGGIVILVDRLAEFLNNIFPAVFHIDTAGGLSTLAVVIVLAMMILPTITMLSITAIKSVPQDIEQGSLALGASEVQTMFRITLNAAKPGIFAGVIIGVGRALGEATAVSLVAGNAGSGPTFSLFDTTRTLTSTILMGLKETQGLDYDIRFSIGLILIFVILITNFILNQIKKWLGKYYA